MLIEGLYTVQTLEQENEEVRARVKLHKEHDVFKGHFPGNPIMPGVCMIQMIKELTEQVTGKTLFLATASNVKFIAKISPEENEFIDLILNISEIDTFIKVKNVTSYEDIVALKLTATFKIIAS